MGTRKVIENEGKIIRFQAPPKVYHKPTYVRDRLNVYVFDFLHKEDFDEIHFESYANEMINERHCRPYIIFDKVGYNFNFEQFIYSASRPIFDLINNTYFEDKKYASNYYFVAFEFINKNGQKIVRCF